MPRSGIKPITFVGSSLDDLREFGLAARRQAGFQLDRVQRGKDPDDFKSMAILGSGVYEIRIHDDSGIFRVIYVAKFPETVYVLHAFRKKTRKTAQMDLDSAKARYKEIVSMRKRL